MSRPTDHASATDPSHSQKSYDPNPPTYATFSPTSNSGYSATSKQRSTIIVHKKSPLLVATPPQITRALAHSHPFLIPLNKLTGLLSWSTPDPWESYLLVAIFWGITLYGSEILLYASPVMVVIGLILGMYSRRYSPLSSTSKTGDKHSAKGHKREPSEAAAQHKTLDEIVDTLHELTARCNILLEPFLTLTDFLSTQTTPTAATTRPALTTLFIRVLLVTPLWIILTLPPLYILTTRRIILTFGTIILTWHSTPARVSRVILWRSVFMRKTAAFITGLDFDTSAHPKGSLRSGLGGNRSKSQTGLASEMATKQRPNSSGVRFTFILYENQRRWIGLGWTTSLFAYERGPWCDEHLNPAPSKDEFELPEVEGGRARWRWVDGSEWRIERGDARQHKRAASQGKTGPTGSTSKEAVDDGGGWIYYDNKWQDGRNLDGWGRYTRRRKWYRDAELVETTPNTDPGSKATPTDPPSESEEEKIRKAKDFAKGIGASAPELPPRNPAIADAPKSNEDNSSVAKSPTNKKGAGWFSKRDRSDSKSSSGNTGQFSARSDRSRDDQDDDVHDKWRDAEGRHRTFGIQEDVAMSLG
ncbi:integral peroxisomal membrane peroxin-domain-containing protein [Exophiala viscosa]|uniref:Integral peroxisomal membrane peroxin-domain-containing protein n=1 Tax=Exophiala viscosa TaxID=2486360 RepID=A0AAN6E719_9EURO|nr:integral peroxisomal membrane peroxin-domain-containing protein [Exophiala viscosa]KAI1628178.1 integral peroxisomal membrane peroxin-domain-containing protein [Exophiala viscosa]